MIRFERKTVACSVIVLGTYARDRLQQDTTSLLGRGQVAEQD